MANVRRVLRGAGRFATALVDPEFERRKAAQELTMRQGEAELTRTGAQTGLIGAQTRGAEAGIETEGLRQDELRQRMDEITRGRAEWDAAVKAGTLKGTNAEIQRAILDAAESDVRREASRASAESSRASAGYHRAQTAELTDPTMRGFRMAALRDRMRWEKARTESAEALTGMRERGPSRQPSEALRQKAEAYAAENVNRGRSGAIARFFGSDNRPLLAESSPEYMREIARLKQEYYAANPETAGGWAAGNEPGAGNLSETAGTGSVQEAAGLPDGIYMDPQTKQLFAVKDGRALELRDQPVGNATGLGQPGVDQEYPY